MINSLYIYYYGIRSKSKAFDMLMSLVQAYIVSAITSANRTHEEFALKTNVCTSLA